MALDDSSPGIYGLLRPCPGGKISNASKGHVTLEIQDDLMRFLVKVCEQILHDQKLDEESLKTVPEEPEEPEPLALSTSKDGTWPGTMDLVRESPYLVPQTQTSDVCNPSYRPDFKSEKIMAGQ